MIFNKGNKVKKIGCIFHVTKVENLKKYGFLKTELKNVNERCQIKL